MAETETKEPAVDMQALLARVEAAEKAAAEAKADAAAARSAAPVAANDAPKKRLKMTKPGGHRAIRRGYVKGEIIEEGQLVPGDVVVSDEWMEPVDGSSRLARAIYEATAEHPGDVDLTQVGLPGLRAMAAERGINPGKLTEAQLITAIKAEREDTI